MFSRHTWQRLLLPTAVTSLTLALCVWWTLHGIGGGTLVPTGCVITLLGCLWMIRRDAQAASAWLKHPQLRGTTFRGTGIYESLLRDAYEVLSQSEAKANAATQGRIELEARIHVRQKQTRRLESALQCLPEPALITDGYDKPVFWNAAAAELFGTEAGHSGTTPQLSQMPEVQSLLAQTRDRSAATASRSIELEVQHGGAKHTFRATATHLLDDDGSSLGVATVLRDIGREKEEKARHADFVSSVAHELKTPMAGIKAFTELLMDGDVEDPVEQMRLYGFIDVQVDRLTRLVTNMLNLARIESGVIKVQREDCGLNEVLDKAVQVVQPMADEKQIRLLPQFSELYLPVNVDRDLFGQAVINLLSNAVKYTPAGGEVKLKSRMTEGEVIIDVQDNGMGIPEEDLSRLFQKFFRVERNSQAAQGTGLGLALVQHIVHNIHNGKVSVQSKVNEGSCFSVTIPLGHRDHSRRKAEAHACAV